MDCDQVGGIYGEWKRRVMDDHLTRCALLICPELSKSLEVGRRASPGFYEIIDFPAVLLCENYALKLVTVHYCARTGRTKGEKLLDTHTFSIRIFAISVRDHDDIMLIRVERS